jgi:hypothetical protein
MYNGIPQYLSTFNKSGEMPRHCLTPPFNLYRYLNIAAKVATVWSCTSPIKFTSINFIKVSREIVKGQMSLINELFFN